MEVKRSTMLVWGDSCTSPEHVYRMLSGSRSARVFSRLEASGECTLGSNSGVVGVTNFSW